MISLCGRICDEVHALRPVKQTLEGGVVILSDPAYMSQRYPEFCRKLLYEDATPEFLEATAEWEKAYGKVRSAFQMIIMTC